MLNWSHIRSCIQVCLCHLDYHANLLLPSTSCRQGIKTAIFRRADINLIKVDCTNLLKWGPNLNALFKHACLDAQSSPGNKSTQNNLRNNFFMDVMQYSSYTLLPYWGLSFFIFLFLTHSFAYTSPIWGKVKQINFKSLWWKWSF